MSYNPHIHHRRSIRLKGYDYSQSGLYFLTLCCQNKQHLFGHIHKDIMCLNPLGAIAHQTWMETPTIRPNVELLAFIVMPNHIHGIIAIKKRKENNNQAAMGKFKSPSQTIGAIIRGYKGSSTKRIKQYIRDSYKGENRFINIGESPSTGELQFAPTAKSKFAPTAKSKFAPTAKSKFAPTAIIDLSKSIWQRDYYDHIIRDERAYNNISNYIITNPERWHKDKFHKK